MRILTVILLVVLGACAPAGPSDPLIRAARGNQPDVIRALVRAGADPDRRGGVNGWTPLLHAIHKNRPEAVRALLEAGADANARGAGGETPLMMAAGYGYADMVRDLLERGADPYLRNPAGETALDYAVGGANDIDRFTLGKCRPATVRAILERAPGLRLSTGAAGRFARAVAAAAGCSAEPAEIDRGR